MNIQDVADFVNCPNSIWKDFFEYLNLQKKFDQKNLCLTGGCALNSLANGKILDRTKFENIFIPYEPSDAGGSIGSALTCYYNKNPNKKKFFQPNPYLGIEYSDEKIEKDLLIETNNKKISFKKFSNFQELCDEVVDLISDQSIISWFQGRMEFGPRALE